MGKVGKRLRYQYDDHVHRSNLVPQEALLVVVLYPSGNRE